MQSQKTRILLLGGTCFLGKAFLDYGQSHGIDYEIHCLNRGTPYWNDAVRKDHPEVIHHHFDRNQAKQASQTILNINKQLQISPASKWKAVVDFSCYDETQQQSLKVLQGLAEKYIYISTDSLYNNSCGRVKVPAREKEFDLQAEFKYLQQHNQIIDQYGYKKMKCQLNLFKMNLKPFLCLRLPDVIGQFDLIIGFQRFWCLLSWLADSESHAIPVDQKFKAKKLSFVDSSDVAKILHQLIQHQQLPTNTAYNLAFDETLTGYQFCQILKKMVYTEAKGQLAFPYPSVQFGTIDCSLAKAQLNWNPTPINQAIERIAKFYLKQGDKYPKQKKLMLEELNNFYSKLHKNY